MYKPNKDTKKLQNEVQEQKNANLNQENAQSHFMQLQYAESNEDLEQNSKLTDEEKENEDSATQQADQSVEILLAEQVVSNQGTVQEIPGDGYNGHWGSVNSIERHLDLIRSDFIQEFPKGNLLNYGPAIISGDSHGLVVEDRVLFDEGVLTIFDPSPEEAFFRSVIEQLSGEGYGLYSINASGTWTYTLNNELVDIQGLAQDQSIRDFFIVYSFDGTPHTVNITINGTNDIPVIGYAEQGGAVIEDQTPDVLIDSGIMNFVDIDLIDTHIISVNYLDSTYDQQLGNLLAILTTAATGGNMAEITWTFSVNNALVQFLPQDITITETYLVSVDDGHGGVDTRIVSVDITGVNDAATFDGKDEGDVTEDQTLSDTGVITVFDIDMGESSLVASSGLSNNGYGSYTFNVNGEWQYFLNNSLDAIQGLAAGQKIYDSITIRSFDGTEHDIIITINGTNDVPVIGYTELTGSVTEDQDPLILTDSGILNFTDIDLIDEHVITVEFMNSNHGSQLGDILAKLNVNATDGNTGEIGWIFSVDNALVQFLPQGITITETYKIIVDDGHGGTDERTITIDITGTNDLPIIGGGDGNTNGTAIEDVKLQHSGILTIADVDQNESYFQASSGVSSNGYGTFIINADGSWIYTLNNESSDIQGLAQDDILNDSFTVYSADNTSYVVDIVISGTNDVPVITNAELTGAVTENNTTNPPINLTDSGIINFTDIDLTDEHEITVTYLRSTHNTQLGNLLAVLPTTATGGNIAEIRWDFSVQNADIVFLEKNQSITETYLITIDDGNGGVVTTEVEIDLLGGNNIPIIGGNDNGVVQEDTTITDSGVLTIADPDPGESSFQAGTTNGTWGTFTIDTNGAWTYSLSNSASNVQELAQGESHSESFNVYSFDGTSHTVDIIINGLNDNPVGRSDSFDLVLNVVPGTPGEPILNFIDFSDTSGLAINGDAKVENDTIDGTVMRMVPSEQAKSGSVFSENMINANEFSTYFEFRMTDGVHTHPGSTFPGADGLVFVIQTNTNSALSEGGNIGYGGIDNSIGIEFDTWRNIEPDFDLGNPHDPDDRHVAVHTNGSLTHTSLTPTYSLLPGTSWDNGEKWHVWIDYNDGVLEVRASQNSSRPVSAMITTTIDIPDIIGSDAAYIGFTSATGAAYHNTDIIHWTYQDSYTPPNPTVTTGTTTGNVLLNDFDIDNGSSFLVGTVNGSAANVGQTITLASGALLTLQANGNFFYDSNGAFNIDPGQTATDSFVYQAIDEHGALSNSTTVTIDMTAQSAPPVVIDLNNDGSIDLSAVSEGVQYDIDGDGSNEQVSWVGPNDGILVFDLHNDGQVTEAKEFVFTMWDETAQTDMEALRNVFDTNGDGALTNEDENWAQFGIWQDKNGDGISDVGEFFTLDELGFERLDLLTDETIQHLNGNTIHGISQLHHKDGYSLGAYDVSLKYVDIIAENSLFDDTPTQQSDSSNLSSSDLPPLANDGDFSAPSPEANLAHDMEMQQQNAEAFG